MQSTATPSVGSDHFALNRTAAGLVLIGALAYACLDTLPLFSENQNTKFLYGLAMAGYGRLDQDWLAQHASLLPVFDRFVEYTYLLAGSWFFYVWHLLALIVYAAAFYGIARIAGLSEADRAGPLGRWFLQIFGVWFVLLNTRHILLKALYGVANQRINGHFFEPQTFGVLALLGLLLFRQGRSSWAIALIVITAWIHPPYALAGFMILCGFVVARWRFPETVTAPLPILAIGFAGCLAAAGFTYLLTNPGESAQSTEALRILTEVRIPAHSWPAVWFEDDAAIKLVGICIVLWLARRDPLGWVIGTVTLCVIALTLWVHFTHDATLALAAPWRASAVIVPAAGAILFGRLASWIWHAVEPWRVGRTAALGVSIAALAAGIGYGIANRIEFFERLAATRPLYAWIADNARDRDVYLTSVFDESFRLATGQPQYVSWKTHPHQTDDVLAWYDRLTRAEVAEKQPRCGLLDQFVSDGVTHVVRYAPAVDLRCPGWRIVYNDNMATVSAYQR